MSFGYGVHDRYNRAIQEGNSPPPQSSYGADSTPFKSHIWDEEELQEQKRKAAEAEAYMSEDRRLHDTAERARQASQAFEEAAGIGDCVPQGWEKI